MTDNSQKDIYQDIRDDSLIYKFIKASTKREDAPKILDGLAALTQERPERHREDQLAIALAVIDLSGDDTLLKDHAVQHLLTIAKQDMDQDMTPAWKMLRLAETYAVSAQSKSALGKIKARKKAIDRKTSHKRDAPWEGRNWI